MDEVAAGVEAVPRRPPQAPIERDRPWLTYAMLALFTGIFLIELLLPGGVPGDFTPDISTLVAMGGVSRSLVEQPGEWHRLFTAALLHASPLHLIFNGIAFWIGGLFLESLVGPAWLFTIFGVGALGGSLMSLALNEPNVVSVGASGAIMAMLSAGLVTTKRIPPEAGRARIQGGLLRMLIPSLLPFMSVHSGEKIDYADHFGGALAGLAVGVVILATWPDVGSPGSEGAELDRGPARAGLAKLLALACAALFLFGGVRVAQLYPSYELGATLIPEDELPQGQSEIVAKAPALLAKFPKDPRSHLFKAIALGADDKNSPAQVEAELRLALANPELLKTHFDVDLEIVIRNLLAVSLLEQHRTAEAKEAVRPVCHAGPDGGVPKDLEDLKLCDAR